MKTESSRAIITAFALAFLLLLAGSQVMAQKPMRPFQARLFNQELNVSMRLNLYEQNVTIPGQELFGQTAGFLRREGTSYCWLIVDAEIDEKNNKALLIMSNDYGSEDLKAELTWTNDSTYVLKHISGATMKVPNNNKWQKLPKIFELKRQKIY